MNPATCIKGSTRLVGLLGASTSHSVSPVFQNDLMQHLSLNMAYVPLPIASARLHEALLFMRSSGFVGANVTIPHKQAVVPWVDRLTVRANQIGAVNTIFFDGTIMWGDTTDGQGFLRALEYDNIAPQGLRVVLLGNGGTARTLAYALLSEAAPQRLVIAGRSGQKVQKLVDELERGEPSTSLKATLFGSTDLSQELELADIIINATSIGMHGSKDRSPLAEHELSPRHFVFDCIYNPLKTALLRDAEKAGCRYQNGLRMLVSQGVISCERWAGQTIDESIIDLEQLETIITENNA